MDHGIPLVRTRGHNFLHSSRTVTVKISPFLRAILAISLFLCTRPVRSSPSKSSWLEVGSYAVYAFNLEMHPGGLLGFDDHALAAPVLGKYSWRCVKLDPNSATLELELDFTVPKNESVRYGSVKYLGKEFVERARKGDLSFIKRIPADQITESRIELSQDPYLVYVWGPIRISRRLAVTVDLNTLELIDDGGKPWGKWAMWVHPTKYPLVGSSPETFIVNWLDTAVELHVSYNNGTIGPPIDTPLGRFEKYFVAYCPPTENKLLLEFGMETPVIILTYAYEPRSGILLQAAAEMYLDDILTQKLGVIFTRGVFTILETNVSFREDNALDISPYVPYLAILAISATIAAAYFVKEKKLIKKR